MSLFSNIRKSDTNLQFLTVVNARKLEKGVNFWRLYIYELNMNKIFLQQTFHGDVPVFKNQKKCNQFANS